MASVLHTLLTLLALGITVIALIYGPRAWRLHRYRNRPYCEPREKVAIGLATNVGFSSANEASARVFAQVSPDLVARTPGDQLKETVAPPPAFVTHVTRQPGAQRATLQTFLLTDPSQATATRNAWRHGFAEKKMLALEEVPNPFKELAREAFPQPRSRRRLAALLYRLRVAPRPTSA